MRFFCKHYGEQLTKGKVFAFCLRKNCWALKITRTEKDLKKLKKRYGKNNKARKI